VLKLSVLQGANGKETGPPASYPKGSHTLPHDPYGSFRPFYQVEEKEHSIARNCRRIHEIHDYRTCTKHKSKISNPGLGRRNKHFWSPRAGNY
jgi:hypothetical protein